MELEDWPTVCRNIVHQLQTDERSVLVSNGAQLYSVNIPKQVRIGWSKGEGKRHVHMILINAKDESYVELMLRVGRHSGLIGDSCPLDSIPVSIDSHRDWGRVELHSTPISNDVFQWLAKASNFTRERYDLMER